ncbi:uncharacterized protein TNCV_1926141 [Trichonephila clavipes]|nr:uncharacterized protein TNCV_1926141 [Trichonephila clavipes]
MCENTDQRICIKFCCKVGKTGTETYEMMKTAFVEEAMSRARVFEWLRRFKEGSCDEILRKDMNMRRVSAKFVPRLLTEDQQFQRLATSPDLFQSERDDPEFMKFIITGDESWVYGYDPETKQQSSQWKTPGSPRPKK